MKHRVAVLWNHNTIDTRHACKEDEKEGRCLKQEKTKTEKLGATTK